MSALADIDGREGEASAITFKPVGPTAQRFLHDQRFITNLMGPYGSGKTTTAFQKTLNATLWQKPDKQGVRRSRGMIVRSTYGQLQTNVMEDWFGWFPKTRDNWNGEQLRHQLRLDIPGTGQLHMDVYFRACEDAARAEALFKGANLTWAWLNEVDTLCPEVMRFLLPRLGRYPPERLGGCAWSGVFSDMNAPDVDNWTYDLLVNGNMGVPDELLTSFQTQFGPRFGVGFHRQPGGLAPDAENRDNLSDGYYERLVMTLSDNDKRRFVDNEFGAVRNGQPVYTQYRDDLHCAQTDIRAVDGRRAVLSLDGGTTPAVLVLQMAPNGQIRVLDEVVVFSSSAATALEQLGPTDFARIVWAKMVQSWPKLKFDPNIWGDPAALAGGYGDDLAWGKIFARELNALAGRGHAFRVRAAPGTKGNRLAPRLEAVRGALTRTIDGYPGLMISPRCKYLRQGFNSGYVYSRLKLSSGGSWRDIPDKGDFSHVHDALQYGVLGLTLRGVTSDDGDADQGVAARRAYGKVSYGGAAATANVGGR